MFAASHDRFAFQVGCEPLPLFVAVQVLRDYGVDEQVMLLGLSIQIWLSDYQLLLFDQKLFVWVNHSDVVCQRVFNKLFKAFI